MEYIVGQQEGIKKNAVPKISLRNGQLNLKHKFIALGTILIPTMATIIALWQVAYLGVNKIDLVLLATFFILTNLGVEFGLHRNLAHKAFETTTFIQILFAVLGSMAAEGRVSYWVASHRRHHIHSDTPNDPHSPNIRAQKNGHEVLGVLRGLWHAHIGHMLADDITNCTLFAADINRNPVLMRLNKLYIFLVLLGLMIPAVISGVLTNSWMGVWNGFLWGGLVRMFLVHQTTWSVASFSHRFGSKPFVTGDLSTNNFWTALISFGSGWQNNHHAFPNSAYLGLKWWQIDITAWLIRFFATLGLTWNIKKPSRAQIDAKLSNQNSQSADSASIL